MKPEEIHMSDQTSHRYSAMVGNDEFVIDAGGKILASSYSDGPLGRIDAADVVRTIRRLESTK